MFLTPSLILIDTIYILAWKTIKTAIDVGTEGLFSMLPEVDKKIQEILQETSETGTWKTVVEMMDPNKTSRDIFPLQHGSIMKFRVFALNENGLSNPPAESEFHKITGNFFWISMSLMISFNIRIF